MQIEPVTLTGAHVRLEPLDQRHAAGLLAAVELDLFRYTPIAPASLTTEAMQAYITTSTTQPARIAFAIVDRASDRAVGTTSYLDIRLEHRGLEIGFTWIGKAYQGTAINPESKYLLLRHAFETLGAIRVQLKTDGRNIQSQRAIAKLGAQREGVLRRHVIMPDGYQRDTVMFSIIDDEWPTIKRQLEARLSRFG